MERFTDLAIVLRSFRYAERDMVVHLLTENHGKITGLAKNAVHSRRFGGTLQTLAVSNISWAVVRRWAWELAGVSNWLMKR